MQCTVVYVSCTPGQWPSEASYAGESTGKGDMTGAVQSSAGQCTIMQCDM